MVWGRRSDVGPVLHVDAGLSARVAVAEDVCVTNRISTLISVFGVLVAAMLLSGAIYEYPGGASVLWVAGGPSCS